MLVTHHLGRSCGSWPRGVVVLLDGRWAANEAREGPLEAFLLRHLRRLVPDSVRLALAIAGRMGRAAQPDRASRACVARAGPGGFQLCPGPDCPGSHRPGSQRPVGNVCTGGHGSAEPGLLTWSGRTPRWTALSLSLSLSHFLARAAMRHSSGELLADFSHSWWGRSSWWHPLSALLHT